MNTDFVWVTDSSDEIAGPDQFLWNEPFIPLVNRDGRVIPPLDRRTTDLFGPRQNYVSTDVILRLTDTTSILGDVYYRHAERASWSRSTSAFPGCAGRT